MNGPPKWAQAPLRGVLRMAVALPRPVGRWLAGPPIEIDGQRLDPAVQLALRVRGGDPYVERTVADSRAELEREARLYRGRRLRVGSVAEMTVAGADGMLPARLYRGRSPSAALVVYLHGGGWVEGSLETHDQVCRFLAREAGAAILSVAYRLAPEHRFPAGLEDALAAFRWAHANAADLGADPRRVAIAGDSAGGNLAAVVTRETARAGNPPAMQALIYPVCDLAEKRPSYRLFAEGFFLSEAKMDWYRRHYLPQAADAADPRVSPLRADHLAGLPPAYVAVAGFDPLRDEGLAYGRRLRDAGVATELRLHPGLVHGFVNAVGLGRPAAPPMRHLARALRAGLSARPKKA